LLLVPLVVLLVGLVVLVVPLVVLVVPLVVLVVFVIIVVGVSRWQRVVNDCDEAPVDQPGGNVFNGRSHVGSCRMSRHSWTDVSSRTGRPGSAQSRENPAQAWGVTRPSAALSWQGKSSRLRAVQPCVRPGAVGLSRMPMALLRPH